MRGLVSMNPIDVELHTALELAQTNRVPEALDRLQKAQVANPRDARFPKLLGELLLWIVRPAEALDALNRAAALNDTDPTVHGHRAFALSALERFPESEEAALRTLSLAPHDFQSHWICARTHLAAQNAVDAAESALAALRLKPDASEVVIFAGAALTYSGEAERACDLTLNYSRAHPDNLPVMLSVAGRMAYSSSMSPAQRTTHAVEVARRVITSGPAATPPILRDPNPDRPLRIGYIAQDIGQRSAITYFIEQVFACHDRERYPITCYLTQPRMSRMTDRMQAHLTRWVDASVLDDAFLARRIRADQIDILVDLAGRTPGHRIGMLLLRPAPIVFNAIGDPQTTGLTCIHHRIVDQITDPPGSERLWTENLVRLPGCFLCYRPPDDAPPSRPPRLSASREPLVFGSLNILAKTGPQVIELWSQLLRRVDNSRLLLKSPAFSHPRMKAAFEQKFARQGIDPERLMLLGRSPELPDHLRTYHQVDIALDPFPYNGTTTSCEALWMGVPMISLLGESHAGRVGASLLTAVGLESLIATDFESFLSIAADLAGDSARLTDLHANLRERMAKSILCNGPAHARSLESAFREAWKSGCAEAAAASPA